MKQPILQPTEEPLQAHELRFEAPSPWKRGCFDTRAEPVFRGLDRPTAVPWRPMKRWQWAWVALGILSGCSSSPGESGADDSFSLEVFADPPAEFGPQARWWWPGGSVGDEQLREQLRDLAELGYSAVEVQPFMATLTNADLASDSAIRTVGNPSFLGHLRSAGCAARDLGLDWDLTLGSGWSTGGPDVGDDGARQLIAAELTLDGPMSYQGPLPTAEPPAWITGTNQVLPAIDGFDEETVLVSVLAAEVLDESDSAPSLLGEVVDLDGNVDGATLSWGVPAGVHRVFAIYENRTKHYPLGNAYPGPLEQARIIDHLDRRGIDGFLERQFGRWLDAVADCPPRAVFIDSFELVGELPWTTAFAERFETALGYDLRPFQPFLFLQGGESEYVNIFGTPDPRYRDLRGDGARAREDYEAMRSALFADELLRHVDSWLGDRGIELRLQAHGGYADALDAYAIADVPESEGLYAGGSYDFLRLAASAAEVAGKRYASSETLVSVGARELTTDEVRLLFGRAFSAGINRLMLHGHAYPYLHGDGVRWFPFHPRPESAVTTGPLDLSFDLHPGASIWEDLPDLNRMAARLSYAMSRGSAEPQLAWLYPNWKIENFPNFGVDPGAFESEASQSLRRAGYSYTRVSRGQLARSSASEGSLEVGEASFEALLVTNIGPVDPEVLTAIEAAANAGVAIIWLGEFPSRADGLVDAETRDRLVGELVERLRGSVVKTSAPTEIPSALSTAGIRPLLRPVDDQALALSITPRRTRNGYLFYLFNESFEETVGRLGSIPSAANVILLDPDSGEALPTRLDGDGVLTLTLGPARGAVLFVEGSALP